MQTAAIVLSVAALGGVAMAAIRLSGRPHPPAWLAHVHGAIAATGVALLAYAAYQGGLPQFGQIALGIFVLAAIGGIAIYAMYHSKDLALPVPFVLVHGLLALAGVGLLWTAVLR